MPSNSVVKFYPCEISRRIYRVKTLRQSGNEILKFSPHLRREICSYPHCKQIAISPFSNRLRLLLLHRAQFVKKVRVIASFRRSVKPRYRLRNLSSRKISRNVRAAKIYKSQNLQKSRRKILTKQSNKEAGAAARQTYARSKILTQTIRQTR